MLADLHPQARFWLDVADKLIKLLAVMVGAAWTWMHYHRSRTYAQKLELQLTGTTFRKEKLYVEVLVGLKNLGASRYTVQQQGTTCEIVAVYTDGSELILDAAPVFEQEGWIEPGETIGDLVYLPIEEPQQALVWLRVNLRVVGKGIEWNGSRLFRVD